MRQHRRSDRVTRATRVAFLAALAFSTAASSADAGRPTAMVTDERGCWELNTVRDASASSVQAALPEGWQPRRNRAGFAMTMFVDYVCAEFSIDGLPARRTIVSWLAALAQDPTTGERRTWTLAHGSDNPLYVQRLRKLGVDSRYLPHSTAEIEPVDATTSAFEMHYGDYARTGTAPEPTGDPSTSPGGVLWFETTDGEALRIAYMNTVQPAATPTVTETFASDSVPAAFGIEDISARTARGLQVFLRGSWTGELTRQDG